MCERCARRTARTATDEHEITHHVQNWAPEYSMSFLEFLGQALYIEPTENQSSNLTTDFSYSKHVFTPSAVGMQVVRLILYAPEGYCNVSLILRRSVQKEMVGSVISGMLNKARFKLTGQHIGTIRCGARVVKKLGNVFDTVNASIKGESGVLGVVDLLSVGQNITTKQSGNRFELHCKPIMVR